MPRFFLVRLLMVVLVVLGSALGCPGETEAWGASASGPAEGETLLYSYRDEQLLMPWQHRGAAAYVPPGVSAARAVPLFVFLHGINPDALPHLWLGGGGKDLRPVVRELSAAQGLRFVVAAPSQTRGATMGRTLWADFDLLLFLASTQAALAGKARIDLGRVYVLGHSGAGCNPDGGLAGVGRGTFAPAGVAVLDTCMDAEMGAAMGRRAEGVKLWVLWQGASWPREPEAFRQAVEESQPEGAWFRMEERAAGRGNPHDALVPDALGLLAPAWASR